MLSLAALVACACLARAAEPAVVFYPGLESWYQTGFAVGNAWAASVLNKSEAYLTYGPYWTPPTAVRARTLVVHMYACHAWF